MIKEALYYKKISENLIQCELCPHFCVIKKGEIGKCKSRKNLGDKLISLNYGLPCSLSIDPIEKKPFFHFFPGRKTLSIATPGCNFSCKNCQNYEISQNSVNEIRCLRVPPEEVIKEAKKEGIKIISYTYTEPTIFYEYMLDICKLAKKEGIKNVIVSNGFINEKPLKELCEYIDAANIDLKSIKDDFYDFVCGGKIEPVLKTIKTLKERGVWVEITNLIVPGLNDSEKEILELVRWVKNEIGKDTPLHFSGFFPNYKMEKNSPTNLRILKRAREIALKEGMAFVYIGNVRETNFSTTSCLFCEKILISRKFNMILENNLKGGKCPNCNLKISGVWE